MFNYTLQRMRAVMRPKQNKANQCKNNDTTLYQANQADSELPTEKMQCQGRERVIERATDLRRNPLRIIS